MWDADSVKLEKLSIGHCPDVARLHIDGIRTGFLVEPKNSKALVEPLKKLVSDAELRKQMGQKGRKRVEQMFDSKNVIQAIVEHRLRMLKKLSSYEKENSAE